MLEERRARQPDLLGSRGELLQPGFVTLGQRLGKEKLFSYIYDFGFGKKTGIDLKGEENGIMFKPKQVGPVELATTAFGQGVSVTPIQQITAVSAAINGGKLFKPFVSKSWIQPRRAWCSRKRSRSWLGKSFLRKLPRR